MFNFKFVFFVDMMFDTTESKFDILEIFSIVTLLL